jgi:hypothetical protein
MVLSLKKYLAPLYSFVFAKPELEESEKYLQATWAKLWLSKKKLNTKSKRKK